MQPFIERDCSIERQGRNYTAAGAAYNGERAVAYFNKREDGSSVMTDWHGNALGYARVVASWPIRNSFWSVRMHQVETRIDHVLYTGRTMGDGMVWSGKRKADQG